MKSTTESQERVSRLLAEHEDLERSLRRLRRTLKRGGRPATTVSLLDDAHSRLVRHFAFEEEGGYFRDMLRRSPRLRPRAKRLLAQHPELLERLERVRELASEATAAPAADALQEAFGAFLALYEEHEQGEEDLLQEAFGRDIGAND